MISMIVETTSSNSSGWSLAVYWIPKPPPAFNLLITIPKNVLNRNYEVQVWGSDSLEINKEHPCYILPEYISGYVNPDNEEIEENPIPLNKRKKYKHKFCNEQTTCQEEKEIFY